MSVRAIEAEVSINSGIEAECTIGREVVVEIHDDVNLETLTATENGSYRPAQGVDGWDRVTVEVPERVPITEPLSVTANGSYTPSEGVDGYSDVTVAVPERVPVTESLSVTENGTYEPSEGIDGYDRVTVAVPPTIPEIEALTVTEDGVYQASGDGYNPVTVSTGVASLRQEIASAETASGCSPLIDGLTALTTYANEVTGQADETLSDAVETLASKYGKAEFNPFAHTYNCEALFRYAELPEFLTLDFENNTNLNTLSYIFRQCTGLKNLTIKNAVLTNGMNGFGYGSSIETITFENCTIQPTTIENFCRGSNIKAIYGEIDCTNCRNCNYLFATAMSLEHFRFKANSISTTMLDWTPNTRGVITPESWISLANALSVESPNSVALKANNRTDIAAIMGTNDNGIFVADPNGSMTLMDFIATVKGWTVT